jgi:hypothetical protein
MASKKTITPVALGSYVHVFEARPPPDGSTGDPKYSISLLFPKKFDDKLEAQRYKAMEDLVAAAAVDKFGPKALEMLKQGKLKSPLRDGDVDRPDDEVYAGKMFLNASSTRQPGLVDAKLQPILDEAEAYSGCSFRASVTFFPYDKAGNKGVGCGLNNLQVVKKGPRIDGRLAADKEFSDFAETGEKSDDNLDDVVG